MIVNIFRSTLSLALFMLVSALSAFAQENTPAPVKLKITGKVDPNSQTTSLWVIRQNDNPRNPTTEIPIVDGKIDYVFEISEPDLFKILSVQDLMQKGMCMPIAFFADNGEISLNGTISEDDSECLKLKMVRTTTPLNNRLIEYNQFKAQNFTSKMDSISDLSQKLSEEEFYSPEGQSFLTELYAVMEEAAENPDSLPLLQQRNELYLKMDKMQKDRRLNSKKYYDLLDQLLEINNQAIDYDLETFGTPDGDLFGLSILSEDFISAYENDSLKARIIDVYLKNYKDRFSNTIMGKRMNEAMIGFEVNLVGGWYPDYQLPDAEGNIHSIKDLIKGRVVLIDLWGSTCGPCRVNSRSMIPIYNEFKDKGLDIIGIAREYNNLDGFYHAVEKDGYPWMQLIELDDANGIFNLHGIPNAMGGTYLVGPGSSDPTDIRVLLLNPTADELREFLIEYYSNKNN